MFFHQFRDDLVLTLELLPQRGDGSQVVALGRAVLALEGGGAVLEEQLLPGVEEGGLQLVLVTEVGDGHSVDQVTPEDGNLLGGRVVLAGLSHGRDSCRVVV
jgi:hypothetical protein